jgi:hypothetical protein
MSSIRKKLVQVGDYLAEVEIKLIDDAGGWGPYVSPEDAYRIDDVRKALKGGDIEEASKIGRIYKITPIAAGHA